MSYVSGPIRASDCAAHDFSIGRDSGVCPACVTELVRGLRALQIRETNLREAVRIGVLFVDEIDPPSYDEFFEAACRAVDVDPESPNAAEAAVAKLGVAEAPA